VLTVAGALALYVLAVAAMLTVGALLAAYGLAGIAASEWLCVAAPTLAAVALSPRSRDVATLLGLRPPPAGAGRSLLAAALVGASAWVVLGYAIVPLQELIAPAPPALTRALERVAAPGGPVLGPLLAVALTPAICEELLCRGAILPALRARLAPSAAILVAALLFGALHLSPYRFVPTFLLGLAFGALAHASGWIVPAMLAHALNNAAVILVSMTAAAPARATLDAHRAVAVGFAVTMLTIGLILVSRPVKVRPSDGQR
jgi:sodium transport system permease protein